MVKGPQPKHPDKRQRRNKPKLSVVTDPAPALLHPPAPEGLPGSLVAAWDDFWSSDVARSVSIEDLPSLTRLFELRADWDRARHMIAESSELVKGSMGQVKLNPLYNRLDAVVGEIRQLEDRFGMNPVARARLAVSIGEFHRTIDDLSAELRNPTDADSDPLQIVDVQDSDA